MLNTKTFIENFKGVFRIGRLFFTKCNVLNYDYYDNLDKNIKYILVRAFGYEIRNKYFYFGKPAIYRIKTKSHIHWIYFIIFVKIESEHIMANKQPQSVEPNIADLANGWLKKYKLDYKLEQESLNTEIDKALSEYFTKNGGSGANRPDAKLLLQDSNLNYWPILIEYKGYKISLLNLMLQIKLKIKLLKTNLTSKT